MNGLIAAHSGLRYIVLLLLVIAVINALINRKSDKFVKKDKLLNLFAMVFVHVQLLLGIVMYFLSPKVRFDSTTMSDPIARFFTMEHALIMIIAMILITIGYSKSKKETEASAKYKLTIRYFGLGLLLIFAAIPWPFIYSVGAGYF